MKLSIIIVNYNVKYFLEHCLHAVSFAVKEIHSEIIVVDNNSADGSIEYLRPKFPSVIFIQNKENTGFAKANNQGLALASGEYILYLNPDTIIAENTLRECVHFLDENTNAAASGVHMLSGSGDFLPESKRSFPSAMTSFYKLFGVEKLFPRSTIFGKYGLGFLDKNRSHAVDVLSGAFLMARSALLKNIGGFDERFFMYGEDIDLSYELQKRGYKNYYLGNLPIIHFKGESTKKGSKKYLKTFYGAMALFVDKHYKGASGAVYTALLKTAVKARAAIATLKQPFTEKENDNAPIRHFFLVGEFTVADKAKKILRKKFPDAEYYTIDKSGSELPGSRENAGIVYCIGKELSYAQAIENLQRQASLINVFWYFENAGSVIGSSSKNRPGEVFV